MRPSSTLPGVLLLALILGLAAGCGGGQSTADVATAANGAAPSPTPSLSRDQMLLNYVQCMRDHGIDMPDPQPGEKGLTLPDTGDGDGDKKGQPADREAAAQTACEPLSPPGFFSAGELTPEELESGLKVASCMRERGFDVPDPGAGSTATGNPRSEAPNPEQNSPQFEAALVECRRQAAR